jgi:hypothetical protein
MKYAYSYSWWFYIFGFFFSNSLIGMNIFNSEITWYYLIKKFLYFDTLTKLAQKLVVITSLFYKDLHRILALDALKKII